jgi:hypothetical protein
LAALEGIEQNISRSRLLSRFKVAIAIMMLPPRHTTTFDDRPFDPGFFQVTNRLVHGEHALNGSHCIRPGELHDGSEIGLVFTQRDPRLPFRRHRLEIAVGLGSLFAFLSSARAGGSCSPEATPAI